LHHQVAGEAVGALHDDRPRTVREQPLYAGVSLITLASFRASRRRSLLKKKGLQRGQYNQIANFVVAQSEINIAIGDS
jgi:hypothetical protein